MKLKGRNDKGKNTHRIKTKVYSFIENFLCKSVFSLLILFILHSSMWGVDLSHGVKPFTLTMSNPMHVFDQRDPKLDPNPGLSYYEATVLSTIPLGSPTSLLFFPRLSSSLLCSISVALPPPQLTVGNQHHINQRNTMCNYIIPSIYQLVSFSRVAHVNKGLLIKA